MRSFLRRKWSKYSKFGRSRKKKRLWRKPKGRDNKMREKLKGYPPVVSIGYRTKKSERIDFPVVRNVKDLTNVGKNKTIVLGRMGKKKKIEVVEKAKSMEIKIQNINIKKFLAGANTTNVGGMKNEPK